MRTLALSLSLFALTLAGCKSAPPDDAYHAYYTTPVPSGSVALPAPPPHALSDTSASPQASRRPAYLPD